VSATAPLATSSMAGGASARGVAVDQATRSLPGGAFAASTNGRSGGGGAPGSPAPAWQTSSHSAVSSTERLRQPKADMPFQRSRSGATEILPRCGFRPTSPQEEAGMRIEPAPSEAKAIGARPAATAAALPPLEPPGVRCGFQGLRVTP
jgi:hypothetical protein